MPTKPFERVKNRDWEQLPQDFTSAILLSCSTEAGRYRTFQKLTAMITIAFSNEESNKKKDTWGAAENTLPLLKPTDLPHCSQSNDICMASASFPYFMFLAWAVIGRILPRTLQKGILRNLVFRLQSVQHKEELR